MSQSPTSARRHGTHPRLTLASPLPLGDRSLADWEEQLLDGELRMTSGVVPGQADARSVHQAVAQLYLSESGASAVVRELTARGTPPPVGTAWDKALVLRLLDELQLPGAGTSPATVAAVRRVRDQRAPHARPGRAGTRPQLLTGLIACGLCEAPYQLETSCRRVGRERYPYRYYACRSASREGRAACAGPRLRLDWLDEAVLALVREAACSEARLTGWGARQGWAPNEASAWVARRLLPVSPLARRYVCHLVEGIEVQDAEVLVFPRRAQRFHGAVLRGQHVE